MAWRCRFLAARPSQVGHVIAENAPDALVDFHTARRADDARAHGAEERQVAPAAVDGVQVVRHRVAVEEVLRAAGGGVWVGGAGRPESACEVLSSRAASLDQPCRDARAAAVQDAGADSSSGSGLMLMIDGCARGWP